MSTISKPPRYLKIDEIIDIVNVLPSIAAAVTDVADSVKENIKNVLILQLTGIQICEEMIPNLKGWIINQFLRSIITPGEAIGITTGEGIAEPITQMNMNTFHQAGSSKQIGIDAFRELFNASANRKNESTTIHFNNKDLTFEEVIEYRKVIIGITVGDLELEHEIISKDVPLEERGWWYPMFHDIMGRTFIDSECFLRIKLNVNMLYAYNITLEDVAKAMETNNDKCDHTLQSLRCITGPPTSGIIDIYPKEDFINAVLQKCIGKDKSIHGGINESNASSLYILHFVIPNLNNLTVKGVSGITNLYPVAIDTLSIVISEEKHVREIQIPELLDEFDNDALNLVIEYLTDDKINDILPNYVNERLINFISKLEDGLVEELVPNYREIDINELYEKLADYLDKEQLELLILSFKDEEENRLLNLLSNKLTNDQLKNLTSDLIQKKKELHENIYENNLWRLWLDPIKMRIEGIDLYKITKLITLAGITIVESLDLKGIGLYEYPENIMKKSSIRDYLLINMPENWIITFEEYLDKKLIETAKKSGNNWKQKLIKLKAEEKREYTPKAYIKMLIDIEQDKASEWVVEQRKLKILYPVYEHTELFKSFTYVYAEVMGSNLKQLLAHPDIDSSRTISNNPHEILKTFGVEAARNFIANDFYQMISDNGSYVNSRYISLIVDFMTNAGLVLPITSRGIARQERGVFADASFEHPMEFFIKAGISGSFQDVKSTSACIFMGKRMNLGTGIMAFSLREDILEELETSAALIRKEKLNVEEITKRINVAAEKLTFSSNYIENDNNEDGFETSDVIADDIYLKQKEEIKALSNNFLCDKGPIPEIRVIIPIVSPWILNIIKDNEAKDESIPSLYGVSVFDLLNKIGSNITPKSVPVKNIDVSSFTKAFSKK